MSTSIRIRKLHLILALLIIALFIISAACSFADKGKSYRPDEKNRDKQSEKYRPGDRDSKNVQVNTDKNYKPDQNKYQSGSDRNTSYKPGTIDTRNTPRDNQLNSRYRSGTNREAKYKPEILQYRNESKSYKPESDYNRNDNNSYRPKTDYNRNDSKSYKPDNDYNRKDSKSYKPDNDYNRKDSKSYRPDNDYNHNDSKSYRPENDYNRNDSKSYRPGTITIRNIPKSYKPPTYKSGRYYYSSRNYRPYRYGYWTFDYYSDFSRKSCYYHYGFLPYIQIVRIYEIPRPSRHYYDSYTTYDRVILDRALEDIRNSWLNGRSDLMDRHIESYSTIAVSLDGSYDYSISGDDYLEMTYDALEEIRTEDFVWEKIRDYNDGTATAYARHTYYDSSRYDKVVYLKYDLERSGDTYIITGVDSSLRRLY